MKSRKISCHDRTSETALSNPPPPPFWLSHRLEQALSHADLLAATIVAMLSLLPDSTFAAKFIGVRCHVFLLQEFAAVSSGADFAFVILTKYFEVRKA